MNKVIVGLALVGAGLVVSSLAGCDRADPPVVIAGAATPGFLDAIRLAVEDGESLRAGVAVDTFLRTESSSRAGPALLVAEEVVGVPGVVAVIGHANSAASLATSQLYNDREIVQIAPSSTAPLYSEAGRFSFRMVPPDDRQGAFLAEALAERFEGARVGLLYVNDDYGRGLRKETLARLDPARFPVVVDLPHTEEALQAIDAEGAVASLAEREVELLLWLGRVPALERILLPLRERLGAIPVIAGDAVSRILVEAGPPGGHWGAVAFVDFLDPVGTPELRAFRERFMERFGRDPGGPEILSYDAARLVLAAIGEGARTGEEVRRFLVSLGRERPPFAGLGGPVTFDAQGDVDRSYVLRVIPGPDR